jgi:3-oxoacyl-[acyl-carrier protein] reductase
MQFTGYRMGRPALQHLGIPKEQLESLVDAHPLKRLGTPEDIAYAAVFLASGEARWITGAVLDVAGGAAMLR